jgi:polysaccharide biosynthesis protein PslH
MRVLILSTWFPYPLSQGSKIRAYYLIRAVAQQHEVALISFEDEKIDPSWLEHIRRFCSRISLVPKNPFSTTRIGNVKGWFSFQPSFVRSSFSQDMAVLIRQTVREWMPDRIIALTFVMGTYNLKENDVPSVIDVDNFMSRMMFESYQDAKGLFTKARRYIAWRKFLNFEKQLYHRFDRCMVVTDYDRAVLSEQLELETDRIYVVPNGVDTSFNFPTDEHPEQNSLVFNGSLLYAANYDAIEYFLRKIFTLVCNEKPTTTLTITGRFDGISLEGFPFAEQVNLTGYLEDIRPVIRKSWACVVPLRLGGGTRLKILEAMALGTPVVSTSKGAEGLNCIAEQHILIADEPVEFAAQILRLMNDPGLRQSLSANANRFVKENFKWEEIGARFSKILD